MADASDNVNRQSVQQPLQAGTASFERVSLLCESFSMELDSALRPTIIHCLAQVSKDAQPTLLRNLLNIEIERRRGAGEQPNADEYIERFPEFATLVRHAFLESSTMSMRQAGHDTAGGKPVELNAPAVNQLGHYRLIRELGRGGMGFVFEGVHVQRGDHVALKTLPMVDGDSLRGFKREFRSLADINHPNLIGLHTLESDGCHWFFTMDLIDGVDFLSYVRPSGYLDEARLRSSLSQLVTGAMALHGNHIVHRDLKPSNVMVKQDGQVILLDFGLVIDFGGATAARSTANIAGTPHYMAPEQAAGEEVTAAADWYAVGVMLYEALSGEKPFRGPLLQVLQDKQSVDPPSIAGQDGIPDDLSSLCMRLLSRDPQQRPDALEIAKVVSSQAESTTFSPTDGKAHLVGREQQLLALKEAHRSLETDQEPVTVFISGRSGEGKTSLAEHFLEPLRDNKQLVVLSGRCYDRESVPFKALDSLIDGLSNYLRSLSDTDAALMMPRDISVLAQLFPVLQRVEVFANAPAVKLSALDEQQVRQRAFGALRELFSRISERMPVLLFIDDLQWGDADSAEVLFEILRPPEAPLILFLGTYRSDETETSSFLQMWAELQRKHDVDLKGRDVTVSPLTVDECTELVISLLGKDNEVVRRRGKEIADETGGNPLLLTELVGCFDPDTDSFRPVPLHEVIGQKLDRLPSDAEHLLEVVAVSGQALSLDEASRTAGHDAPAVSTLTHMRNERLVRLVGSEENQLVDTYHDRIRETVLGKLEDGPRRSIHLSLAEVIEETVGGVSREQVAALEQGEERPEEAETAIERVYDLAYHFDAAGQQRNAWIYGLLAAEQARRQFALEVATEQYAIAKRNAEATTNSARYRIAKGYGEAFMLLGRYDQATDELDDAIQRTDDPVGKARIEALQGENAFKQGAVNDSIIYFESGLRRLGNRVPRTLGGFAFGILRESLIQCLHSLRPKRLYRNSQSRQVELTIQLYNSFFLPTCFQSTPKMLWAHLSGLNRAELVPPSPGLALGSSIHGMMMSMLGWHGRGTVYSDRAMTLARELNDLRLTASSYDRTGIGYHASARYEDGVAVFDEAISSFEKAGDMWELNLAHFHRGCCHYGLGNLAEAVAEARWTFESSGRIGDSRTLCSSYLWARASKGNIPFEELKSCYPNRPDDIMSTVHGIMAEGHWHTFHGRTEEALLQFERAGELIRKSHCVNSHMIVALPELAAALRRHADAVRSKDPHHSELLRKRALRLAKWAVRMTRLFPAAYPQSLRELSLNLAAKGRTNKALKYADKSCAVAERQNAKYEYAQSSLMRARLRHQLKMPNADNETEAAEAELEAFAKMIEEVEDGSLT